MRRYRRIIHAFRNLTSSSTPRPSPACPFIRAAIENELNGRPELIKTEDLITGGFEGMSRDNLRIVRGQQALHALLDTFVKTVLTCLPEPSIDAQPQAVARAKDRYHLLIKAAGRSISGDALAGLKDLVTHGTN
jgi:hypothetical protein